MPRFRICITEQGWLGTPTDDYEPAAVDLCTHGDIHLSIGGEVIAAGEGGDGYGISEAALGLLRTIESDYRGDADERYADRLIPHGCGTILMMGCGIGIDWSVEHLRDEVRISDVVRYESPDGGSAIRFPGLEVLVPSTEYRAEAMAFARHAKAPFEGIEKTFSTPDERLEYVAFWKEYDDLLAAAFEEQLAVDARTARSLGILFTIRTKTHRGAPWQTLHADIADLADALALALTTTDYGFEIGLFTAGPARLSGFVYWTSAHPELLNSPVIGLGLT